MPIFKRPINAWLTLYALFAVLYFTVVLTYIRQESEGEAWLFTRIALVIGIIGLLSGVTRLILDLRNPKTRRHLLSRLDQSSKPDDKE
jgi:formate-dependent nitrite reductase membrane component NrfD